MKSIFLLSIGLVVGIGSSAWAADPKPLVDPKPVDAHVESYLRQHCASCHDARQAKAGFRVDLLTADFAAVRMADHWKEVADRINVGEMPPEKQPRPTAAEQGPVVEWINLKLREADLAAKSAGGQTPMRRLNRDEYANTVRDLLFLDEAFVRPLIEELPGDGKAEGFDRLGVGLFFDQTQMQRALQVAERIAAKAIVEGGPARPEEYVWEAEKYAPEMRPKVSYGELSGVKDKMIDAGVGMLEKRDNGVVWIHGLNTYRKETESWRGMAHLTPNLEKLVKADGYYRVRVLAGADRGARNEPVRMKFEYGRGTPISADFEMTIDAPLDQPRVHQVMVFLRAGEPGLKRQLVPLWNPIPDLIKSNPIKDRHFASVNGTRSKIEKAVAAKASEAEIAALRADLQKYMADAATFEGPLMIYNPERDPRTAPRLFIDSIMVDGPYPSAELPKDRTTPKIVLEAEKHPRFQPPRGGPADTPGFTWRKDGVDIVQGLPNRNEEIAKFGPVGGGALDNHVTQDGYYRFRIHATVDKRGGQVGSFLLSYAGSTPVAQQKELPVDPSGVSEVTLFLRAGEPGMKRELRLLWTDTRNAVIAEPVRAKLEAQRKQTIAAIRDGLAANRDVAALRKQLDEIEAKQTALKTPQRIWNPALDVAKLPVLRLDKIEVEGPIESEWPPRSHKSLLFAGDTNSDEGYIREVFTRFLPRAYRRPVRPEEVEQVVRIVRSAMDEQKLSFIPAMRLGLARVLCSSGFWFTEREQPANPQYAVASRLSYFLWSTMPDEELFDLARNGRLTDKAVLSAQVDRMLTDPRSNQLVRNFVGQWLNVREFGTVEPANEYRDYDSALKAAGAEEPFAFFEELLKNDLPATNFLDSDFVVINERLARHYGIEGVSGSAFRRVAIKPDHHRGGVLGMAGLMTYLADGTRTLPMRRGTWILTNLFDDPPGNPPPNAGEIQPNVAGQNLSLRQRIEMHRTNETCASCHAKLDPYGLALENYDAIGAWRTRANGEGFRANRAPAIDPSGTFLNGPSFANVEEFKARLLEKKDKFARCLVIKMLTYALGRPIGYTDHDVVDALVAEMKKNDYRVKALVKSIVLHKAFGTK